MTRFKVPVRVSVAPVQTFEKVVTVDADSRAEAARKIGDAITNIIHSPGWRAVGGRVGTLRPDLTFYDTQLDERGLSEWAEGLNEVGEQDTAKP